MEHDLEILRKSGVWVLFAFTVFATGMHAWLRLQAAGAQGLPGPPPDVEGLWRRAKRWRVAAAASGLSAVALSALRWFGGT